MAAGRPSPSMSDPSADLFGAKGSFVSKEKDPIRKKLFRSPVVDGERVSEEVTLTLMNRLQIEHDIEISYKALKKDDMHEQRLKQMRQTLKKLSEDDWRYPDVDKLIGLN